MVPTMRRSFVLWKVNQTLSTTVVVPSTNNIAVKQFPILHVKVITINFKVEIDCKIAEKANEIKLFIYKNSVRDISCVCISALNLF
jgi:hypothetical protein